MLSLLFVLYNMMPLEFPFMYIQCNKYAICKFNIDINVCMTGNCILINNIRITKLNSKQHCVLYILTTVSNTLRK